MSIAAFRHRGRDHAGHVAVADQHDARAGLAAPWRSARRARSRSRMQTMRSDDLALLGLGEVAQVLADRCVEIDHAVGQAAADGDLVHVDVGRVQEVAVLGQRHHGQRVGPALGGDRGAFQRIDGDVDRRARRRRPSRRYRASAPRPSRPRRSRRCRRWRRWSKRRAHGLDGGAVGLVLLAAADPAWRRRARRPRSRAPAPGPGCGPVIRRVRPVPCLSDRRRFLARL